MLKIVSNYNLKYLNFFKLNLCIESNLEVFFHNSGSIF